MGIKGLLPFLKDQQQIVNIKSFRGCTAAVDVYCWLHKAVYGCVEQLAIAGNDQGQYIRYCEKYWNLLISNGVKPILVFDGQNLPAKANTEKERRERRKANRDKANALLAEGKKSEARQYFERCIDITPQMAHKVIVAAVSQGIDCIVAPYEADAQLAYLSHSGIAQLIISEDSDLLCFGCERVMFKMDLNGNGIVFEKERVFEHKQFKKKISLDGFTKMCILSGCDYLPSLPGIGLVKACKFICQNYMATDVSSMLKRLSLSIKLPPSSVTEEYIQQFSVAVMTFKHQVVFDPLTRKRRPLTEVRDGCCGAEHPNDMTFAGHYFPADKSLQMALGNINLNTMDTLLPEIDPDLLLGRENGKLSIWHPSYKPKGSFDKKELDNQITRNQHTKEQVVVIPTERITGLQNKHLDSNIEELLDAIGEESQETCSSQTDDGSLHDSLVSEISQDSKSSQKTPIASSSTIVVTPKQVLSRSFTSSCAPKVEEGLTSTEGLPAHGSSSKAKQAENTFSRDKLRGSSHSQADSPSQSTGIVKSRFFSSPLSPPLTSTQKTEDSPSGSSQKYKAKFLGALDEQERASPGPALFRWSKSSLHQNDTLDSSDSMKSNGQYKSPLLKSKLESAFMRGNGSSEPNLDHLRSNLGLPNPFKKEEQPQTSSESVLGKPAIQMSSGDDNSIFSSELKKLGSNSSSKTVSQKLEKFTLHKAFEILPKSAKISRHCLSSPDFYKKTEASELEYLSQQKTAVSSNSDSTVLSDSVVDDDKIQGLDSRKRNGGATDSSGQAKLSKISDFDSSGVNLSSGDPDCFVNKDGRDREPEVIENVNEFKVKKEARHSGCSKSPSQISKTKISAKAKKQKNGVKENKCVGVASFLAKFSRTVPEKLAKGDRSPLQRSPTENRNVVIDLT